MTTPAAGPRRRTVLAASAATAAATTAVTTAATITAPAARAADVVRRATHDVFAHGVASGDPRSRAVVLWTRVTPTRAATPGSGKGPRTSVRWEVAKDPSFRRVVKRGRVTTGASRDHTVKVDVAGLRPETWYWYRFRAKGQTSRVGRTRTAPANGSTPDHVRIGFASCSNWPVGYFSAYRGLAQREDLHLIVHLGDYLYEYGSTGVREHAPAREIVTLADYRQRHAQYKTDPDLQDAHASVPWVTTWDDHEVTNDSWADGADNHQPETEGDYGRRKARAHRAYDEWMPVRMDGTADLRDGTRLYRRLRFGRLAELSMLDLRSYRSQQVEQVGLDTSVDDPDRTMTGDAQMAWLKKGLRNDRAQWKVIGNSVMFAPLKVASLPGPVVDALNSLTPVVPQDGVYANADQWDGYTADRTEIIDHLVEGGVTDTVFITGDIHTGWAMDVPTDVGSYPLTPNAAVEFVCASVTSTNFNESFGVPAHDPVTVAAGAAVQAANPHIRYFNPDDNGFCVLDLTAERAQCDWFVVSDVADRDATISWDVSYRTLAGTQTVERADAPVE